MSRWRHASGLQPAALRTFALLALGCAGGAPTPASLRQAIPAGPFTLSVSRTETVALTESHSASGEGLGLAVFVELSIPDPGPAVAAEIAELRAEERRIGQTISNLRFTRRNFDDSELTEQLVDAVERREELEEEAYRAAPRARLLRRAIRVFDDQGREFRPDGYVTEETYERQMRFREGSAEEPFRMLAAAREEAGYREGGSPQAWALLFRLPREAGALTLRIDNPWPGENQPRSVALDLGRP